MERQNCVFPILVAVLIFHACGWTSVTDARDDADIKARLAALEIGQRENQVKIRALRAIVADQKGTIDKQSLKLRTLEQDITTLKASQHRQVKRFQRAERLLQAVLTRRKIEVDRKEKPSETVSSVLRQNGNGKDIQSRKRSDEHIHIHRLNRQASRGVAFTAYLDHGVDLGAQQAIKFNRIITNEGGGYSNNTGVFTCIMDGMYMFYFAIGVRDDHQQFVSLRINSQNIVDGAAEAAHAAQDIQGGNIATVRLRQGDSVWVESIHQFNSHLEGDFDLRFTTFTGIYLYP